jgi:hypothetical protein
MNLGALYDKMWLCLQACGDFANVAMLVSVVQG